MTKHAEDLAKLGWQYFECPACGSEGARAFPKPEQPNDFQPDWDAMAVMVGEQQRMAKRIEELEALERQTDPESAYQRGYLDGIGRECPHCKDYKAMYIKMRDELAAEQQITQRQTARIVDLQTHINNLEGDT